MSQAYSNNGKYLACGSMDGIVNIFNLENQQLLHKIEGVYFCGVFAGGGYLCRVSRSWDSGLDAMYVESPLINPPGRF